MTTLVLRDSPFAVADKWFHLLEPNKTVLDLLKSVKGVPAAVFTHGQAQVGGVPIPRDWWSRVRVKADSQLFVAVVPKGGNRSGGKDIIATIGTLALIAGAAFISGGALGPAGFGLLGSSFAAGGFGAQALALGFTVVGSLALNALAPPPIAPNVDQGFSQQQKEIAGVTGNPLGIREYLPRVLGTMRASPPHLMWPYTELVDGEVVANALVGLAGRHSIADIQIAGAAIDEFEGLTYQTRTGAADDTPITLFEGRSAVEQSVNETLSEFQLQTASGQTDYLVDQVTPENSYPKWKSFKTRGIADRVDIRLFWPSGILFQNNQRGTQPTIVQFRQVGSDTWINGPELWWSDPNAKPQQKRQHIRFIWAEAPGGLINSNADTFARAAIGDTPQAYQWKPDAAFAPVSDYFAESVNISDDGFDIYLDPATFPKGQYEIRIKRGYQVGYSSMNFTTYVALGDAAKTRFYDTISASAPYLAGNNQDDQAGPVVVETFLTRSDDYPLTQTGLTLIAVRAVGVRVDQISALFTSIVPGRDSDLWHFDDGVDGWVESQDCDLSNVDGKLVITHTGSVECGFQRSGLSIIGSDFPIIRARVRRIAGAGSWRGAIFPWWAPNAGPNGGIAAQYIAAPSNLDEWNIVTWDMTSLFVGGSGWIDNTILGFRMDLGLFSNTDVWEVDWIAVGVAGIDDWVEVPTNNPACLYRHVLASDLNSKPLPAAAIDDVELEDWHDRCLDKGYECNASIQGNSVDQTKQLIASAGWALPQQSEKWGVIQERDLSAEAPVQLFTQRNTRGFSVENSFSDLPHAIVAEFFDQDDDYKPAERIVYFPGYSALNATLFETIRYDGNTRGSKVAARAGLDRDQLLYRQRLITFDADMAHLVSPRGTLVAVSNDTLGRIYDAARIKSVSASGGDITGFVLDSEVNIEAAPLDVFSPADIFAEADIFGDSATSGITVQTDDASTITLEINQTADTDTVTLTTPLPDPGTITPNLSVAVGRLDREHLRCRILGIDRVKDYNARITVVDEAPQIHA